MSQIHGIHSAPAVPRPAGLRQADTRARRPAHRDTHYWAQQDNASQASTCGKPGLFARLLARLCQPFKGVP